MSFLCPATVASCFKELQNVNKTTRTVVAQRRVCRQVDVVLGAVLHEVVLKEERVRLNLVHSL